MHSLIKNVKKYKLLYKLSWHNHDLNLELFTSRTRGANSLLWSLLFYADRTSAYLEKALLGQ